VVVLPMILALAAGCSGGNANLADESTLDTPISSLAILPLPCADQTADAQDDLLQQLGEAIGKRYKLSPLSGIALGRATWRELDSSTAECVQAFESRLAAGREAVAQLQLSRALEALDQTTEFLPWCGAEIRSTAPLVDLFLSRGLAHLSRGHRDQAEADFRQAVALDNQVSPPAGRFAADQAEVLERARRQLLSGNPKPVQIESEPAGASVVVDGKVLGAAPLTLQLYPGRHFVRLELPGHAGWSRVLSDELPPPRLKGTLFKIPPFPPPEALLESALTEETLPERALEALRSLAAMLQVDAILLVAISKPQGKLQLQARLSVPKGDWVGEARTFAVGPAPAKSLAAMAKAFKEIGWKPKSKKKPAPAP
jgi:tetratricopeptide (TPR) repeat protein